jgi:hypothetical protein
MTGPDVIVPPQQMPEAIALHAAELEKIQQALSKLNARESGLALRGTPFYSLDWLR